jgi:cephalosporin hydroxylase
VPATLVEIGLRHGTDKATPSRGIGAIYERLCRPLREKSFTMVEIGVADGASVRTWEDYFSQARILGVDCNPDAKTHASDRVEILIGDQADPDFLKRLGEEHGPFMLVIDDGGHLPHQQLTTLHLLWPAVCPGGLYVVEDIHTSYLEMWGGGYRQPGTFMERLKEILDDVNQWWHQRPVMLEDLYSVELYAELCVFRKREHPHRPFEPTPIG